MTDDKAIRVWDILEQHSVGMLTTRFAGGLRARPLDARPDRDNGMLLFLTDIRGLKDDEIGVHPEVCFTVIGPDDNVYLSITGRATVSEDNIAAARIWKKADDVWWPDGPQDSNVRVLRIEPSMAELWDGPSSSIVAAVEFIKARLTGDKPDLGETRKVTVDLKA